MSVMNQNETRADLGEAAEAENHVPEPTNVRLNVSPGEDHEHGFGVVEVLRVVFVALAAAAVWFHLWEPFPGKRDRPRGYPYRRLPHFQRGV